ncbi:hypothetical protein [Niabella hirudinis]|uniref:hypothetical protein n=1 Tax=Niabella hirudinis TaxID=1285929 RepID=UPI003EBA28C7
MSSVKKIIYAIACFCIAPVALFSQEKTDGLPISLEVVTGKVYTDGAVRLQGTTTSLDKDPGQVAIEIKKPDGNSDKLFVRADKSDGDFFVKYTPKAVGRYIATAFSPDKLKTATAEFEVEANWGSPEVIESAGKEVEATMAAIESATEQLIAEKLMRPDKEPALKEKVKRAKDRLKEYRTALNDLKEGLDNAHKIILKFPGFGPYTKMPEKAGAVDSYLQEQNQEVKGIRENLGSAKLKGEDVCGRLHALSEGCALFSSLMNIKSKKIAAIIKNIAIDKAWPEFYKREVASQNQRGDAENFLAVQAGKAMASAEGKLSNLASFDYGAGVIGDLTQFISDQVRKELCGEYSGELEGEYALEFKNNGKRYLYYKYKYAGKISLMARKEKMQQEGANFSGYLEGNINDVEFDDNIWAVEDKSKWDEEYYKRLKMVVVPINLNKNDPGFGAIVRQGMPGAFYFPLKGKIVKGRMIIELLPPMMELSATNANRTAIIVSDPNNAFARRGVLFTYPVTTARFIITRSMRMDDKNPKTELSIKNEAEGNRIEGNFMRTETPADTKVDFKLKFIMKQE